MITNLFRSCIDWIKKDKVPNIHKIDLDVETLRESEYPLGAELRPYIALRS
ncbi:MAG: hypothetical protein HKN76_16835 [Saprospiraceae bacterium]|nr:hypothetical protein [Saprospiraceae bacterium]